MPLEIERRFLLADTSFLANHAPVYYRQGYLLSTPLKTIRVRIAGTQSFLTVKGQKHGLSCLEFEYSIPLHDAEIMLQTLATEGKIEKNRYSVDYASVTWEIDAFLGDNQGLYLAEIELHSENQTVALPSWLGPEVTDDPRYQNACLAKKPFNQW